MSTEFLYDQREWLYQQYVVEGQTLTAMAELASTSRNTVTRRLSKFGIPLRSTIASASEEAIANWLTTLFVDITRNTRSIIPPKELDIYSHSSKLAVEFCGIFWHSANNGKTVNYHREKFRECAKIGIQLFTIFEPFWADRPTLIQSTILRFINWSAVTMQADELSVNVSKGNNSTLQELHVGGETDHTELITASITSTGEIVGVMSVLRTGNNVVIDRYFSASQAALDVLILALRTHYSECHVLLRLNNMWDSAIGLDQEWEIELQEAPMPMYSKDGRTFVDSKHGNTARLLIWDCGYDVYRLKEKAT